MRLSLLLMPLLATLTLLSGPALAESDRLENLVREANQHYDKGDFPTAIVKYREALLGGLDNPRLRYNLANALYRTGSVGKAIAEYRKALVDLPREADIYANLELARKQVKNKPKLDDPSLGSRWARGILWPRTHFSPFELQFATLVSYCALWLMLMALIVRSSFGLKALTTLVALITVYGALLVFCSRLDRNGDVRWAAPALEQSIRPAVVISAEAEVHSGNAKHFQVIFILNEGAEVEVSEKRGSWLKIELPGEKQGWLPEHQVAVI